MFATKSLFSLLVSVLTVVTFALIARPAFAGGEPTPLEDHLTCYRVLEDSKIAEFLKVYLQNQFGLVEANVYVQAQLYCTASAKIEGNETIKILDSHAYLSPGDFICYAIKSRTDSPGTIQVADPFGDRSLTLGGVRTICTPAVTFVD